MNSNLTTKELATLDEFAASSENVGTLITKPLHGYQNARAGGQQVAQQMNVNQKRGRSNCTPSAALNDAQLEKAKAVLRDKASLSELQVAREIIHEL